MHVHVDVCVSACVCVCVCVCVRVYCWWQTGGGIFLRMMTNSSADKHSLQAATTFSPFD